MQVSVTCQITKQILPLRSDVELPLGFIRESGQYVVAYDGPSGSIPRLSIGDEQVAAARTAVQTTSMHVEWDWNVDFYAGEIVLLVSQDEKPLLDLAVDVAPHPGKLGAEAYEELLSELQEMAEGVLFGGSPAHSRLEHAPVKSPPMARLSLLIAYMTKLERAFAAIESSPHRRLQGLREDRSLQNIRRVDNHTLRLALKRMPVLAALTCETLHPSATTPTLNVPIREHTYNTSPNRHVLSLLFRLKQTCESLSEIFERHAASPDTAPASTQRMKRLLRETTVFRNRFERLIRNSHVLKGLSPQAPDTAALLTVSWHPVYARFDQLARRVLNPAVSIGNDADKMLSLRSTYTLYEYWCFFAVAEALRRALPEIEWQRDEGVRSNELFLNLSRGLALRAELAPSQQITLSFQECYSPHPRRDDRPGSISRECNPDIVLTYERPETKKILILDAKYRSAVDSIHAGLDDMHVYRDAIRTAAGKPAIDAAFILTPTHHSAVSRFYTEEYRRRYHFGAFDLAPQKEEHIATLAAFLRTFVTAT